MRFITRSSIAASVICLVALLGAVRPAAAQQTTWDVSNAAELTTALAGAFNNNVANPSLLNTITLTGTISGTSQWIVNANVNIVGGGFTIDMQNADRAFFIAGGTVGISNLTIKRGNAVGGNGGLGGGGGAGLGGGIFVSSGSYSGWTTNDNPQPIVAALGLSVPSVTLSGVSFANNAAIGGGSTFSFGNGLASGGGGMGGNGSIGGGDNGGGGGGGFGNSAVAGGGTGSNGAAGAFVNVSPTTGNTLSAGSGGSGDGNGGAGGATGGGGGGGGDSGLSRVGSGGGGGVGAGRGYFTNSTPPNNGGNGGFGGGGGGNAGEFGNGGTGGFGGGGGASVQSGGNGGFGGGGGKASSGSPGGGGFGAASATPTGSGGNDSAGGGGLGAGGAVFVMAGASVTVTSGTFVSNTVTGGTGGAGNNGSAYGADLFLGGNVVFSTTGTTVVNSLGGAGNLADQNVANNAGDPNANGGVIMAGSGMLLLTGTSYYSGITTVNSGTFALAPNATEQGTTVVTVGQNPGDVATLGLGSSSSLFLGGFNVTTPSASTDQPVMIAQAAGSTGTVVIGNGAGSNGADIGARVFTGGAGNASVVFTQQYWAAGTNLVYPFYTSLTGSLGIVQNGLGTTSLQPLYGANTFTGPVTVNVGTLETTGTAAALAGATSITVNAEGALLLGQTNGVNDSAAVTLAGGELFTGTSLSETFGALNVTVGGWSIIDFMGNSSTLNFSSLSLDGSLASLAILNYDGANDFLNIASGTATGSLSRIAFYSDSGSTLLGYGGFEGTRLVPVAVPEPSTWAMALAGLGCGGYVVRRRRKRD
jgi:hypothetical protein